MALDKEQAVLLFENIVKMNPSYCKDTDAKHMPDDLKSIVTAFAESIYALGVADERERAAKVCDEIADGVHEAEAGQCAEAIRKG